MSDSDTTLRTLQRLLDGRECAGPVPSKTIDTIEAQLAVQLPQSFRLFLAHFGAGALPPPYEVYGAPSSRASDPEPARWVHILDADAQRRRYDDHLPSSFVAFAGDGCGIELFLDTSKIVDSGECPVVARGPGVDDVVVAPSFLAFAEAAISGDPLAVL